MQQQKVKTYRNLYFDLDNTLWDFQKNSEETLKELIDVLFPNQIIDFSRFLNTYYPINEKLWVLYRKGIIPKEQLRTKRFTDTFKQLGIIDEKKIEQLSNTYLEQSPLKTGLYPHAIETLGYLKQKGYRMFLLTNGFKEVQKVKIAHSGLDLFFDRMITSEEAGYQKPHRRIFDFALKTVNSKKNESLMIGDDLDTDIEGALKYGLDCVLFNPNKKKHRQKVNFEIESLHQLTFFL